MVKQLFPCKATLLIIGIIIVEVLGDISVKAFSSSECDEVRIYLYEKGSKTTLKLEPSLDSKLQRLCEEFFESSNTLGKKIIILSDSVKEIKSEHAIEIEYPCDKTFTVHLVSPVDKAPRVSKTVRGNRLLIPLSGEKYVGRKEGDPHVEVYFYDSRFRWPTTPFLAPRDTREILELL